MKNNNSIMGFSKKSFIIIFLLLIVVIVILTHENKDSQKASPSNISESNSNINSSSGVYKNYTYEVIYNTSDQDIVVTFKPFLERDDIIVLGAIEEVIQYHFKDQIQLNNFRTEDRNGTSVIIFPESDYQYSVVLVKEEDGKVHSIRIIKE